MNNPTDTDTPFSGLTALRKANIKRRRERERKRTKYDDVLMENALSWGKKAVCRSIQVGAVLAIEGRSIMSGYNGTVMGADNCCVEDNEGMDASDTSKKSRVIHAEINAILFCAKKGISTEGATLYVTYNPCSVCAALIAQAGITRVVYNKLFKDEGGIADLKSYGIEVNQFLLNVHEDLERMKKIIKEKKINLETGDTITRVFSDDELVTADNDKPDHDNGTNG